MSVHMNGSGDVYQDGVSGKTGTWHTEGMNQNTFKFDELPQGVGGSDKTFEWTEPGAYYLHPPGSLANATSKVSFEYAGVIDGKPTWRWREWSRGSTNDPWPTLPTATGTVT